MMRWFFINSGGSLQHVRAASGRWIAGALALTLLPWLVALAGLLAVANRVHDDVLVATGEQMYLHVDSNAGKAALVDSAVRAKLEKICASQAGLSHQPA